jgi:acetyltransferase-like isoleucine patch superfamily enzyme
MRGLLRKLRYAPRKIGYVWGPRLMSSLRKRWIIWRHPHAKIEFGRYTHVGPGFSLHIPSDGEFIVGEAVEFRHGFRAEVHHGASIRIGSQSVFTYNVLIQCASSIEIGEHCMFGQSTGIFDGNHRFRDLEVPMIYQGYDLKPLRLSDHVTITTKCTVMANIGTRAFIGANSVVSRDIPPYCLAVGAPARVIDYFGPPGSEPPEWEDSSRYGATGPSAGSAASSDSQASRNPAASA